MIPLETDEEIITSYKNGNEEVFKILIERYTSPLFNFVGHLTDKNNAPDIVQDIFIKVWKNLKKFDEKKASFKTWIFSIAKNTVTDFLRKKKSILFSNLHILNESESEANEEKYENFSENIPDDSLLPDEALQKIQDSDLLNKILDKLPTNYKTILILHYQEDLTFDDIGKILNKPLNTVKSWHHRALILLREMIEQ